jgi:mannobiose 2-epimerase
MNLEVSETLSKIVQEWKDEYTSILQWWSTYLPDKSNGFHGEITLHNKPVDSAIRGLVLYSRILWTFSNATLNGYGKPYAELSTNAFHYLQTYFHDKLHGGYYWSVSAAGIPVESHKQLYGQAFVLYAFAAYYKATGDQEVLDAAKDIFNLLEKYGKDPVYGGYWEARGPEWQPVSKRLSEKDPVVDKSMNTHLHILEAYAFLYTIWPDEKLGYAIKSLLEVFTTKIIDPQDYHLHTYFNASWQSQSTRRSFGHDIEASWLLYEAAQVLQDPIDLNNNMAHISVRMASSAISGIDTDGGMLNEFDFQTRHMNREKHWWPQAECIPGFLNAYAISNDSVYLDHALNAWSFIKSSMRHTSGEWIWGLDKWGEVLPESKAGFWKCPYHNSRACLEGIQRLSAKLGESSK